MQIKNHLFAKIYLPLNSTILIKIKLDIIEKGEIAPFLPTVKIRYLIGVFTVFPMLITA